MDSGTLKLRDENEGYQRKNTIACLQIAKPWMPTIGKFLDVGAADGWTVELIEKTYPGLKGIGVTIDQSDVDEMNKYKVKNKLCVAENIALEFEKDSIDMIYTRQTLEHTDSPYLSSKAMYEVLKPGGIAIVSVPEYNLKYLTCKSHKYVMPQESWQEIFQKTGFKIELMNAIIDFETEYLFILKKEVTK